ncbi:Metal tolerance protein 3 [Daldinia childiae]|uniref:Metal tolerance protein 3 n=1 Tax=Daldinia childiae TaxID=326645 RepID=UPI001446542D|nr:Metal tolerance protein 3 [Daldinia childiae]KAF3055985.1 Metal tolerance protein 3 [Daldinia childiae]
MTSNNSPSAASRSHLSDYQHGQASSSRSSVHTPVSQSHHSPVPHHNATSTGVEAMDENGDHPVARHPASTATDIESQTGPNRYGGSDPYNLSSAFKTPEQLDEIKANTARKRTGAVSSSIGQLTSNLRARRVQTFYHKQNDTIKQMLKSVEEHSTEAQNEAGDDNLRVKIAVMGSFVANVFLAGLQIYGAVSSGSLSLFTTMADAIFDPMSNLTLILVQQSMKRVDPNRFPSGKARLETVGNIAFCFMMTAVSAILIAFSCQDISNRRGTTEVNNFHLPSVIAVCVAFATKFGLFMYCWGIKDKYSQVNILWQDHRNDLLINGFGVLTSVGGSKLAWWLDPMGAIIISLIISGAWLHQAFEEFMTLVGRAADIDVHRLITYVCLTYSDAILGIDTVRVYHAGPKLIAEIDIVMDPTDPLRITHDVSEGLQTELEKLPNIERAYVHVDYETTHKPEHSFRKDL